MQQRARLKALDRFKSNDNAVLVASDVAARGLDVTVSASFPSILLSSCIIVHPGSSAEANQLLSVCFTGLQSTLHRIQPLYTLGYNVLGAS